MTWTISDSGTTSALTIGTETTLATDTNNGTFVFQTETANMVAGDMLEARVYTINLSGGTLTQTWKGTWAGLQINNEKISPPIASDQSVKCTLLQRGGTITITTVTGTVPSGSLVTGQTSGATAYVYQPGGGNVSGTTTTVVMVTGSVPFTNGETIQLSVGNSFVLNAAPAGRTFAWKMLRI